MRWRPNGHQDSNNCQLAILTLAPTPRAALVAGPVAGAAPAAIAQIAKAPMFTCPMAVGTLPRPRHSDCLLCAELMIPSVDLDFDADVRYRIIRRRRRRRSISLEIVLPPLRLVADDVIGFSELPIFCFGNKVAGIAVRMNRDGLLPEGSPDLIGAGVLLDAKHRIVVRFNSHRIILSCTGAESKKFGSTGRSRTCDYPINNRAPQTDRGIGGMAVAAGLEPALPG